MKTIDSANIREVVLPFSDGLMSARVWTAGERSVVLVPELGLHCYGATDAEASFRLFTTLLKYYRQLKAHREKLGARGIEHLSFLEEWVHSIEKKMSAPSRSNVVPFGRRK